MHRFQVYLLSLLCGATSLTAGQIYGTLRDGSGKGLPNIPIVIVSPTKATYEGKTGPDGSYQIFVKENGRCEFQVNTGGKAPATANVFSYADPAKYEFELVGGVLKGK